MPGREHGDPAQGETADRQLAQILKSFLNQTSDTFDAKRGRLFSCPISHKMSNPNEQPEQDEERSFHMTITFILAPPGGSTEYTRQSLRPLQHRLPIPPRLEETGTVLTGAELAQMHPSLERLGRLAPVLLLASSFSSSHAPRT